MEPFLIKHKINCPPPTNHYTENKMRDDFNDIVDATGDSSDGDDDDDDALCNSKN